MVRLGWIKTLIVGEETTCSNGYANNLNILVEIVFKVSKQITFITTQKCTKLT